MLIEITNPDGIRITKSDTDGTFVHFKGRATQGGIEVCSLPTDGPDNVLGKILKDWAISQYEPEVARHWPNKSIFYSIPTLITCPYTKDCCGCLSIEYHSRRQQIEVKCGECGQASVIMNHEGKLLTQTIGLKSSKG